MRDYDPITGRYLQADPLGLVDGASVYGYVGQSPMRKIDPTGEFGIVGAVGGAAGNFFLQLFVNYNRYGLDWRMVKCMDIKSIAVAGILGSVGVSPLGSGVKAAARRGTATKFGQDAAMTIYVQLLPTVPIVLGDECCAENQDNLGLGETWSTILGVSH
jgi:hypothetical protein